MKYNLNLNGTCELNTGANKSELAKNRTKPSEWLQIPSLTHTNEPGPVKHSWWEKFKLAPPPQTRLCSLRAAELGPMDKWANIICDPWNIIILCLNPSWGVPLVSRPSVFWEHRDTRTCPFRKNLRGADNWNKAVSAARERGHLWSDATAERKFFREGQAWHSLWDQTWSDSCSANEAFGTLWLFIIISRFISFSARSPDVHHVPAWWGSRFILAVAFQKTPCERNHSVQLCST